ncbi:MAG: PEGA domain-containing protein [bacterium]|jgi:hypothetical protein|nr:PEGA domain-containing protein [Planctomycetota bacterium]HIL53369.1 PEGA domain-containing protein [Planctomycetota bacterium]
MRLAQTLLAGCCLALSTGCTTYRDYQAVHISSTPPGAVVLVDGESSGFATPCMLALEKRTQVVSLEKPGFLAAERELVPNPKNDTWLWSEASADPQTANFALWINLDDFVAPVRRTHELEGARIHVHLKRLADQ